MKGERCQPLPLMGSGEHSSLALLVLRSARVAHYYLQTLQEQSFIESELVFKYPEYLQFHFKEKLYVESGFKKLDPTRVQRRTVNQILPSKYDAHQKNAVCAAYDFYKYRVRRLISIVDRATYLVDSEAVSA